MTTSAAATPAVGDQIASLSRRVTQEQIDAYAEASGDFNPIHVDPEFARSVGLGGTIAHGLLEMGILAEAISEWAGSADRLRSLECRFNKALMAGDTIICSGRVAAVDTREGLATLEVEAVSDRGDRVLTNGRATVRLES